MAMSPRAVAEAFKQESSDREICLLTIVHPAWTEPIRLSTDATTFLRYADDGSPMYGTVSRGMTFEYLPLTPVLPDSHDEQPPKARVMIDDVSRAVSPYLRLIDDQLPKVTVEVVLAGTPDIVDQVWPELTLRTSGGDASMVEATLEMDIGTDDAIPWLRFVPAYFWNLFA